MNLAAALQAYQQAENLRRHQAAQQYAAADAQRQKAAAEMAAFLEQLRQFLISKGSPGLTHFSIQLTEEEVVPAVRHRKNYIISEERRIPATYRDAYGWRLTYESNYDDYSDPPGNWLVLGEDGTLWVTYGSTVYLNGSFPGQRDTGRYTLKGTPSGLETDIIPSVAALLEQLGLQWDGGAAQTASSPIADDEMLKQHRHDVRAYLDLLQQFMSELSFPGLSNIENSESNALGQPAQGWVVTRDDSHGVQRKLMLCTNGDVWIITDDPSPRSERYEHVYNIDYRDPLIAKSKVEAGIIRLTRQLWVRRDWEKWYETHA